MARQNRIWIELDRPPYEEPEEVQRAFMEEQCNLATKMLDKLRDPHNNGPRFFVGIYRDDPIYCYGDNGGFKRLVDRGEWFNLDHLAR